MKPLVLLTLLSVVLYACEDDPVQCCFEPAGSAHYFINNETTSELQVTYITSSELGTQLIDSVSSILPGSAAKIMEDGIIGVNPVPTNSFSSLSFLKLSDSSEYIISTIINEDWAVISRDYEPGGYGLTTYQLTIVDSQFQ